MVAQMKINPYFFVSLTTLALFLFVVPVHAQGPGDDSGQSEKYRAVFDDVQTGISSGDITLFAHHFASKVAVNLRDTESGTFSANQMYYVLHGYFKIRQFGRFEFSTFGESDSNPYASGTAESMANGSREIVQVYVALSLDGDKYVITQLTIY